MERVRSIEASVEIDTNKNTYTIEKAEDESIFAFLDRARAWAAEVLDVDPPAPADPDEDEEEDMGTCEQCGRHECMPECSNYDADDPAGASE